MLITGEKTPDQISAMRECGKILATIYDELRSYVQAGMSELDIDNWVEKRIKELGAEATYRTEEVEFPGAICISVNDELVHSPPTDYVLQRGDVVSFDLVISYRGMKTDSAFTMVVDQAPAGAVKHLINTTEQSLYSGIKAIKGGELRVGDISSAIQAVLEKGNLGIIRNLVGHGVGHQMHMAPEIPNFGVRGAGPVLRTGDTIAIEPMASLGREEIITDNDGWTISMKDGSIGAHFEHTVLITDDGAEILTSL
ncbi:type I methionyl aminopeptidase [Candidatus Saccharibacteria bacterium 32-50-10]|nr:MAG: type I methionyl aminopeptidase [Candidatus Saccharibacteria bacterium 32-50-10]